MVPGFGPKAEQWRREIPRLDGQPTSQLAPETSGSERDHVSKTKAAAEESTSGRHLASTVRSAPTHKFITHMPACLSSIANAPLYGERDGNGSGYVWLDSCQQLFTGRHQPSVIKVHRGRKLGLEAVLCLATECIVRLSLFGAHTDLDLTEVCLPQPPDFAAEGQGCSTLLRRRSQSKVTTALSLSLFFAQALTVAHPDLEGNSPASAPYTLGL